MQLLSLGDLDELAALHKACFPSKPWDKKQLQSSLSLETTSAYGLKEEGRLLAFVLVQSCGDEHEVLSIGVHPEHRKRGLGRVLLKKLTVELRVGSLFLEVAEDNWSAIHLYESLDFTVFSCRKGYYFRENDAIDALNYRLILKG